jgi:hypothetical protein
LAARVQQDDQCVDHSTDDPQPAAVDEDQQSAYQITTGGYKRNGGTSGSLQIAHTEHAQLDQQVAECGELSKHDSQPHHAHRCSSGMSVLNSVHKNLLFFISDVQLDAITKVV